MAKPDPIGLSAKTIGPRQPGRPQSMVGGADVIAAARTVGAIAQPALGADWSVQVPGLNFTVASVLAHASRATLVYTLDLWGGREAGAAFGLSVSVDAPNHAILKSMMMAAQLCAASVGTAPVGLRGFHVWGSPDAEGFSAMACDELLVHGHDAASSLGLELRVSQDLAARVLARLFPWHAHLLPDEMGDVAKVGGCNERSASDVGRTGKGPGPWELLLWANGRVQVDGLPHQDGWQWHCGPLSEWEEPS